MTRLLVLIAAVLLALPASASAQKVEDQFVNSDIPLRIDHLIGFTPTYAGWLNPNYGPVTPERVRWAGRTYRFTYSTSAAAVGPTIDIYVRNALQMRRSPKPEGFFFDRELRPGAERTHLRVRLDLGRDADVLAVKRGHPACAGISRAAAKGIAAGKVRTWSAAGVAGAPVDAIALRRAGTGETAEPRFGASYKLPAGARLAFDGGLGEASGSPAVAAVTSWSRARSRQLAVCAVPIGGATLSDEAVRALSHPDAHPIRYVTLKRLKPRRGGSLEPIVRGWLQFLAGPRATKQFAQRGLLPAKGPWPAVRTTADEMPPPPAEPQPAPEQPPSEPPMPPPDPEPAP